METPAQRGARLTTALEELSRAVMASLAAGDFAEVVRLQERAAPLITHLAESGEAPNNVLRDRIAAWIAMNQRVSAQIAGELSRINRELAGIEAAQRRLVRLAPAYRHGSGPAARWSTSG
jgi:hypothetical protein